MPAVLGAEALEDCREQPGIRNHAVNEGSRLNRQGSLPVYCNEAPFPAQLKGLDQLFARVDADGGVAAPGGVVKNVLCLKAA